MKKFINKALLYREWKTAKWLMAGILVEFMYIWITRFNRVKYDCKQILNGSVRGVIKKDEMIKGVVSGFFNYDLSMDTLLIIIISIVIVASIIIGIDRFNKNFIGICHMPFTRNQIILNKWVIGMSVIEVPTFIVFLAMLMVYYKNLAILNSVIGVNVIIKWYVLNSLVYAFILTFTMLVQCLTSISAIGAIWSLGLLFLPSVLLWFPLISILGSNEGRFTNIMNKIIPPITLAAYNYEYDFKTAAYILPVFLRTLILVLAITVCLVLLQYCFKRNSLEKVSSVIVFDSLKLPFKISASLGLGIIGAFLIAFILEIEPSLIWLSIFIICAIAIYFLTDKIVKSNLYNSKSS